MTILSIVFIIIGIVLLLAAIFLCIALYKWVRPDWCAEKFMRDKYLSTANVKKRAKMAKEARQVFTSFTTSVLAVFGLLLITLGVILLF